jgi:hypothetical protein
VPAGKNKSHAWGLGQNDADCRHKFVNTFAVNKSAGEKDNGRFICSRIALVHKHVFNPIAHDPNAVIDTWAIIAQKVTLALRQADDAVRTINDGLLVLPLTDALRWPCTKLVFGAVKRMHRIDERDAKSLTQLLRHMKHPEGVKMKQVRTPRVRNARQRVEIKRPGDFEDGGPRRPS